MEVQVRPLSTIVAEFNSTARKLIKMLEKKSRREDELANLDRLKKRISLLLSSMGDWILVQEASPFFFKYSEQILDVNEQRREKFFMELDVSSEIAKNAGALDKQNEFMLALIESIRAHYRLASAAEKADVYQAVATMLACCAEYAAIKK